MTLNFKKPQGLTVPTTLLKLIHDEITKQKVDITANNALTLNFRDTDYSATTGGYHPVEIRIEKIGSTHKPDHWLLVYITDFSYQGGPHPELVTEIDICFVSNRIHSLYGGNLSPYLGQELLSLFITNFVSYYESDVYTTHISFD